MNSNWSCSPETVNSCKNWRFFSRVTLKFDGCPCKTIGRLFCATSSCVHHFKSIDEVKLELQSVNAQFMSKLAIFLVPRDLEIQWWMTLENNRAPLPYYIKLCASFHSHWWIQTGVTVRKRPIWVKMDAYFNLEIWRMTLKNNRAPLLSDMKLCASFHRHMWIQTEVTTRERLNGLMTSVTFTFDFWPWPLARTSGLSMVITWSQLKTIGGNRPISQISRCTRQISHNAPFCNRNVHMYKMAYCRMRYRCTVGFVRWVYWVCTRPIAVYPPVRTSMLVPMLKKKLSRILDERKEHTFSNINSWFGGFNKTIRFR